MEGWFALSVVLSTAILMLSLIVCLPDLIDTIRGWLQTEAPAYRFGSASHTQQASQLVLLCETLTVISGLYLVVALFIKSNTR
ncbi:MAG: hypothetical protein ABI806_16695 [Candidatus Solibacter sp.]